MTIITLLEFWECKNNQIQIFEGLQRSIILSKSDVLPKKEPWSIQIQINTCMVPCMEKVYSKNQNYLIPHTRIPTDITKLQPELYKHNICL